MDVQLRYLERHIAAPYRTYAFLDGESLAHAGRFDVTFEGGTRHAPKLNALAERIAEEAAPDDLLVFIDGDAFPVVGFDEPAARLLGERPLAAVQRAENLGDPQPHPCFCVTTVGFWQEIGGDWLEGPQWQNSIGEWQTDVGARLMKALDDRGLEWTPLLRSNRRDLHAILFGVYGDLVYHHGAGFREPLTRTDSRWIRKRMVELATSEEERERWREKLRRERAAENARMDAEVYERIRSDPDFWRALFY